MAGRCAEGLLLLRQLPPLLLRAGADRSNTEPLAVII